MGAFRVVLVSVVGNRFGSAGLQDVLIEANVLASGSVDAVLEGRHYNRGLRVHKLVSEALGRMRWSAFRKWNENHAYNLNLDELAHDFEDLRVEINQHNLKAVVQSRAFPSMVQRRDRYNSDNNLGQMVSFGNNIWTRLTCSCSS